MSAKFYWKSSCTTCREARGLVRALDAAIEERNYSKSPLTKDELEEILAVADVERVLNARHAIAKASGWRSAPPSRSAFIEAALGDNNLLRRPILIREGRAVVGKDEPAIRELLG